MMLPNMTPEGISQLAAKGFQAVPQLCSAASGNAASLRSTLTSVLGSSRDASEVMQVSFQCLLGDIASDMLVRGQHLRMLQA